jgi:hypothetical protein
MLDTHVLGLVDAHLALIDAVSVQMAEVERELRCLARIDQRLLALQTIYGVGPIVACHLLAEIRAARRFRRADQVVRVAGLDPVVLDSAETKRRGNLSKQGSPHLRWALIQAAQHAAIIRLQAPTATITSRSGNGSAARGLRSRPHAGSPSAPTTSSPRSRTPPDRPTSDDRRPQSNGDQAWARSRHRAPPTPGLSQRPPSYRGSATGPSPVDRARNGSKHHLLVDASGIPLAWTLTCGNPNDVTQLIPLLKPVPLMRSKVGRPRRRPDRVTRRSRLRPRQVPARVASARHRLGDRPPRDRGRARGAVERTLTPLERRADAACPATRPDPTPTRRNRRLEARAIQARARHRVKDVGEPCEGKNLTHGSKRRREETNASRPQPRGARRLPPTPPLSLCLVCFRRLEGAFCRVLGAASFDRATDQPARRQKTAERHVPRGYGSILADARRGRQGHNPRRAVVTMIGRLRSVGPAVVRSAPH